MHPSGTYERKTMNISERWHGFLFLKRMKLLLVLRRCLVLSDLGGHACLVIVAQESAPTFGIHWTLLARGSYQIMSGG